MNLGTVAIYMLWWLCGFDAARCIRFYCRYAVASRAYRYGHCTLILIHLRCDCVCVFIFYVYFRCRVFMVKVRAF